MEDLTQQLLNEFDMLISQQPHNQQQIMITLGQLEARLVPLEGDDYDKYGYYKYIIAERCLASLILDQRQREKYQRHQIQFTEEYSRYLYQHAQPDIELNEEEEQQIQYQLMLFERQNEQGVNPITPVLNLGRNALAVIKKVPLVEVGKAVLRGSSPIYRVATTSLQLAEGAAVAARACVSWGSLIACTSIAAIEAIYIYYKYQKQLAQCTNETQRKEAKKHIIQEYKALGVRTASSFVIVTSTTVTGAAFGSLICPGIGTIIGGILGAIIGAVGSYKMDKHVWDPLFLEKKDFVAECERELGLEEFRAQNSRDYTREEFEQKVKRSLLIEHPDRYQGDALRANARARVFKIQLAKEMIKKHRGWSN